MLQPNEIERTSDLPGLWQLAINLVSLELSADRIVILLDDGQPDLALAAYRRIDPELLYAGVHVNLAVLKQALNTRQVVREGNLQRAVVCCPVLDGEVVRLLIYADRFVDDGLFEHDEVQNLELIGNLLARQWRKLQPEPAAPEPASAEAPPPEDDPKQPETEPIPPALAAEEGPASKSNDAQDSSLESGKLSPGASSTSGIESKVISSREVGESAVKPKPAGSARSRLVAGRYQLGKTVLTCRFSTLIQATDMKQGESMILRRLEMPSDGVRFPESSVKLPVTQDNLSGAGGDASAKISKFREARNQLLREGRFLARLEHRNLPRVYEVLEDQGQVFLVLEDFSGQTLEQAEGNQSEPLSQFLLLRYFEQLLDVLEYLHHQDPPVIHRDLRPDGILVSHYGVLKLAEFGLAKLRETPGDTGKTSFKAQGSPYFASAEQLLGEPSLPANDFYSLGCILFYLATKQMPPRVLDRFAGISDWPKLSSLRPDLPLGFSDLIESLTEVNPEHRCVDFARLRATVQAIKNPSSVLGSIPDAQALAQQPLEVSEQPTELQTATVEAAALDLQEAQSDKPDPNVQLEPVAAPSPAQKSTLSKLVDKFVGWNFLLKRSTPVEPVLPPLLPLPLVGQESPTVLDTEAPVGAIVVAEQLEPAVGTVPAEERSADDVVKTPSDESAGSANLVEFAELAGPEPLQIELPESDLALEAKATGETGSQMATLVGAEQTPREMEMTSVKKPVVGAAGPAELGFTATTLTQFKQRVLSEDSDQSGRLILLCGPSNRRNAWALDSLTQFAQDLGAVHYRLDQLEPHSRGFSSFSLTEMDSAKVGFLEGLVRNGSTLMMDIQATSVGESLLHLVDSGFNRMRLPYLVGFVAMEHVVRRLCCHCKEAQKISYAQRQFFLKHCSELSVPEPPDTLWAATGCSVCNQTGFLGIQTLYERFELTVQDHKVIQVGSSLELFEHHVRGVDRPSFLSTAILKVMDGQIGLDEVLPLGGFSLGAETASSSKGRKSR